MSNVDSSGGIGGRVGRSMDYSQLLEIRRKYVGVNHMTLNNASNTNTIKPFFNQDKKLREPSTNGAVDYYFTRGLYPLFQRVGTSK
jgi:hypothetical protein|uniref:Uncharacterized protein n=1 Tax=viral metagenome TaxID=1070528 RepID=A0A6C0B1U5_9ZZZZ